MGKKPAKSDVAERESKREKEVNASWDAGKMRANSRVGLLFAALLRRLPQIGRRRSTARRHCHCSIKYSLRQ